MLRVTPFKLSSMEVDVEDDIMDVITPPSKGDKPLDTPASAMTDVVRRRNLTSWTNSPDMNGSFNEIRQETRRPLGRFHSFDVKRSLFSAKRLGDDLENDGISPLAKRPRDLLEETEENKAPCPIISALDQITGDPDLIADGSRACSIPTVKGKHPDLKCISPSTMASVLRGDYDDVIGHVKVIDCRYPYEYDGGHIEDAINVYTKEGIQSFLQDNLASATNKVLIFHCEFSSERGPKLYRFLRSLDRDLNKEYYPRLYFPEIYLLEGGYKAFFQNHKDQCTPCAYTPMLHKDHSAELRHFRVKSKSWAGEKTVYNNMSRVSLRF